MRRIYLVAIIAAVTVTGVTSTEFADEFADIPTECPKLDGQNATQIPHESDCHKFYKCHMGDKTEITCPKSLCFNPELRVCDWPQNVICCRGEIPNPPTTQPPTSQPPTTDPPSTEPPSTPPPPTESPSTEPPTTQPPTTQSSTTDPPTTDPPTTEPPSTELPSTETPTTDPSTTEPPSTELPSTETPSTEPPTTDPSTTEPPSTELPSTETPSTEPPTIRPPTTQPSSTQPPSTGDDDCASHKNGYKVKDETDCRQYYECEGARKIGPYICRDNLYFNPVICECDVSSNVSRQCTQ